MAIDPKTIAEFDRATRAGALTGGQPTAEWFRVAGAILREREEMLALLRGLKKGKCLIWSTAERDYVQGCPVCGAISDEPCEPDCRLSALLTPSQSSLS